MLEDGDTIPEGGETVSYTLQPQAAMTLIDQSTGEVKALVGGRGEKTASKTLNRATSTARQPGSTYKDVYKRQHWYFCLVQNKKAGVGIHAAPAFLF